MMSLYTVHSQGGRPEDTDIWTKGPTAFVCSCWRECACRVLRGSVRIYLCRIEPMVECNALCVLEDLSSFTVHCNENHNLGSPYERVSIWFAFRNSPSPRLPQIRLSYYSVVSFQLYDDFVFPNMTFYIPSLWYILSEPFFNVSCFLMGNLFYDDITLNVKPRSYLFRSKSSNISVWYWANYLLPKRPVGIVYLVCLSRLCVCWWSSLVCNISIMLV